MNQTCIIPGRLYRRLQLDDVGMGMNLCEVRDAQYVTDDFESSTAYHWAPKKNMADLLIEVVENVNAQPTYTGEINVGSLTPAYHPTVGSVLQPQPSTFLNHVYSHFPWVTMSKCEHPVFVEIADRPK